MTARQGNILEGLNHQQRAAVEHIDGPLLIVAGPGSGKTRVIAHRVAYLVRVVNINPHRICAVTFTNKAAKEMRERLQRLLGTRVEQLTCSTFHAFCARVLRNDGLAIGLDSHFTIYDADDQKGVVKQAVELANVDPRRFNLDAIHDAISRAKAQLLDVEEYGGQVGSYFEEMVARVYQQYQALLTRNQAVDFDDLLLKTYRLFRDHVEVLTKYQSRYLHLLVDEFQDTNIAQYAVAKQLAGMHRNICVVGDPDQAIYSWRHADIRNILSFQRDFPEARVVNLDENYRSTQVILKAAQEVIAANQQRLEQQLFTRREGGTPLVVTEAYDETEEAQWVIREVDRLHREEDWRYADCAVMYRVNAQSRALEEACLRHGIPYKLVGAVRFYQRKEVKDAVAYLRLSLNPADDVSLARVLNVPPRGIGEKTQDELVRWARVKGLSLAGALEGLSPDASPEEPPIPRAGRAALARFSALLGDLREASLRLSVVELLDLALVRTGYREFLLQQEVGGEERWENVLELRGIAGEFGDLKPPDGLAAFLERVSLVSDQDNLDESKEGLTLITLHQAKGLEFRAVFMVGMEDGLLPHSRSFDDPSQMEEERRLCYVGMTRAKDRLYLVRAFRRHLMGSSNRCEPSRFLRDVPTNLWTTPAGLVNTTLLNRPRDGVAHVAASPPPSKPPLKAGDHVRHPKFGEGVVVICTPSGQDHEVTVAFSSGGIKRLLYSLAPLEKQE
ncbi:MAG: UvrD-helicase domain-containing protein [Chloroflexi bacterium]|nr:UvrD-helicase domain-containing protein [Chloroflexota bacterium]